jgi:allophanate hydrolase subunit 2
MLTGSIQVPPDGQPMIFLADHPTTGGYPVLGVVLPDDLPVLAQARPGTTVRLRRVGSAGV